MKKKFLSKRIQPKNNLVQCVLAPKTFGQKRINSKNFGSKEKLVNNRFWFKLQGVS